MCFPVGLYLMFRETNWKKSIKYTITGVFILLGVVGGFEFIASVFFLTSFLIIIYGLFSVFRKSSRRRGIAVLVFGALLFAGTYPVVGAQVAEQEKIEQQELAAQAEAERIAEEEKLEEIARQEEQERLEAEEQLKEDIVEAIEKVEDEPTQENYDAAVELLDSLDEEDSELETRLTEAKPAVEEYEEQLATAKEAVDEAIESKDRATYDNANELVTALSVSNSGLDRQMRSLDRELTEIEEEERLAAEKAEEERIAQEKAAEEERVAAEKAAQEEAERQAAQEAATAEEARQRAASQPKESAPAQSSQSDNKETVVYIAPQSGTKYHYSSNCRGLSNANSIQEMSLSEAQGAGYDLCGWED
jgi:hypothetical protein